MDVNGVSFHLLFGERDWRPIYERVDDPEEKKRIEKMKRVNGTVVDVDD